MYRLSPLLHKMMENLIPKEIAEGGRRHIVESKAKILYREKNGSAPGRKDFCSYIFEKKDEMRISDWEMAAHSQALIAAGSETSATLLSGLTYYLCRTPEVYTKLKEEVRWRFRSSEEITSQNATFPYLTAVINETLRIYPPIPIGLPRVAPEGGEMVGGYFVPGGVNISPFYLSPFYLGSEGEYADEHRRPSVCTCGPFHTTQRTSRTLIPSSLSAGLIQIAPITSALESISCGSKSMHGTEVSCRDPVCAVGTR